jgi:CRP-like cAMP-binding protein
VKQDILMSKFRNLSSSVKRVLKEFHIFKSLAESVQEHCACDCVHYVRERKGQLLFEEGDLPELCYIILSGEVTVWESVERQANMPNEEKSQNSFMLTVERPPMTPASPAAHEKCSILASMLVAMDGHGRGSMTTTKPCKRRSTLWDDSIVQLSCIPKAALGPGSMFGEAALLNDLPRNATISCWTDCEFLVIEKHDFDRLLKSEMKKAKDEKMEFLNTFVPGIRTLHTDAAERLLQYFVKEAVPRNHMFISQGDLLDGSFYFVWEGSCETYSKDPSTGVKRHGIFVRGSLFAAFPQGQEASCSTVAISTPCEVLRVKPEAKRHLPEAVIVALREVLDLSMQRRTAESIPLSPMGSAFGLLRPMSTAGFSPQNQAGIPRATTASNSKLPRSRTEKMPRPMSGKMPAAGSRKQVSQRPSTVGTQLTTTCSLPSFAGLFQRVVQEVDYEAFTLDPGETIAMTAKKPRRREQRFKQESGLKSLPSLF